MAKRREFTKEEASTLLYLETRAVDYHGRVNQANLNARDREIIAGWVSEKYVKFGRIVLRDVTPSGSEWVELSAAAWRDVARLRRERAESGLSSRSYTRTCEKDEMAPARGAASC